MQQAIRIPIKKRVTKINNQILWVPRRGRVRKGPNKLKLYKPRTEMACIQEGVKDQYKSTTLRDRGHHLKCKIEGNQEQR